jgi:hypothetical protein
VSAKHLSGFSGVGCADMSVPFLLRTKQFRLQWILRGHYVVDTFANFCLSNICSFLLGLGSIADCDILKYTKMGLILI